MHFLAQIDLAGAAASYPGAWPLPRTGQLAFFVASRPGDRNAAVLHVSGAREETPPPADALPVNSLLSEPIEGAPVVFPRAPVGFTGFPALAEDDPDDDDARDAQIAEAVRPRFSGGVGHVLGDRGSWHQILGDAVSLQGNAVVEHAADLLLLQLVSDAAVGWRWGDQGTFQFWIPPAAAARGDFGAVEATFECHT